MVGCSSQARPSQVLSSFGEWFEMVTELHENDRHRKGRYFNPNNRKCCTGVNRVQRWTSGQTLSQTRTRTRTRRLSTPLDSSFLESRSMSCCAGFKSKLGGRKNNPSGTTHGEDSLGHVRGTKPYCARGFSEAKCGKGPAGWRVCKACQNRLIVENLL